MTYKILHGLCPDNLRHKFVERSMVSEYKTRNYRDLQIPKVRLEYAKRSFYFSGVKNWNEFPGNIREQESLARSKKRLRKYLQNLQDPTTKFSTRFLRLKKVYKFKCIQNSIYLCTKCYIRHIGCPLLLLIFFIIKIFKEGWLFSCRCFSRDPPFKCLIQLKRNKISVKTLITTATKSIEELYTIMKVKKQIIKVGC